MGVLTRFLALSCAILAVNGFYGANSSVEMLNASNFDKKVIASDENWVVEFFASWCGHCKSFAPEYEKAAKAMKGVVKFGAVEDETLMAKFGVQGFPTVKFFAAGAKTSPKDYQQARTADALVNFALGESSKIVKERLSGKASNASSSQKPETPNNNNKKAGGDAVVVLTDQNFDKLVMQDNKNVWFIEFYAPWCGHCKNLQPEWDSMARKVQEAGVNVKIGKVDATVETMIAQRYQVRGYPTLKLLSTDKSQAAQDYNGPRTASGLEEYAMSFASAVAAEAQQLLTDSQFTETCENKLCVIALLPSLYDSTAAERNQYLKTMNDAIANAGRIPVSFFWMEGGKSFDFEEQLGLQFGYPAVIGIHLQKGYAILKGAYTTSALNTFFTGLTIGRVSVSPVPKNLKPLEKSKPWDGKDIARDEL